MERYMDDDMLVEHGKDTTQMWVKYEDCVQEIALTKADAQATIAALQARVQELEAIKIPDDAFTYCAYCGEKSPVDEHNEDLSAHIKVCPKHPMRDVESQLTQRTAECDALKLVNDTHMKTVMKLSHVVEQRTAELEALKIHCTIVEEHKVIAYKDAANLQAELERVKQELRDADEKADEYRKALHDVETERVLPLSIELERVRGELAETSLYLQQERANRDSLAACVDRDVKTIKELRTLIMALPKVEGKIEVHTFKNTNQVVVTYNRGIIIGTLYGLDHAKPVAALYEHRQGMEG